MTKDHTDYLIARALCIAAGAPETDQSDSDDMLDLVIDRYPLLAQQLLHDITGDQPAPHLRVIN